jgi:hypothetical protein
MLGSIKVMLRICRDNVAGQSRCIYAGRVVYDALLVGSATPSTSNYSTFAPMLLTAVLPSSMQ